MCIRDSLGTVRDSQIVALVPESASDARLALIELSSLDIPRESLLIEPHAVDLFDGTLREQLDTKRPAPDASPDTTNDPDTWAHAALESAGADDLLRILPEGLDTRILDRGANLLSLIHISEPTRREWLSRMPSSA